MIDRDSSAEDSAVPATPVRMDATRHNEANPKLFKDLDGTLPSSSKALLKSTSPGTPAPTDLQRETNRQLKRLAQEYVLRLRVEKRQALEVARWAAMREITFQRLGQHGYSPRRAQSLARSENIALQRLEAMGVERRGQEKVKRPTSGQELADLAEAEQRAKGL